MFGKGPVVRCLLKVGIGANRCESVMVRETVTRFSFENSVSQIQLEMAASAYLTKNVI